MRRSIIAILAIALLQVGYMAYFQYEVSRDRLYASMGRVAEPFVGLTQNADISAIDERTAFAVFGDDLLDETDIDLTDDGEHFAVDRSAMPSANRQNPRRGKRGFTMNNVSFDDTVITVARTEPIKFRQYSEPIRSNIAYSVDVRPDVEQAKPKKKNVFRKALPVVKKPYDWVKALGRTFKKDNTDQ